MVRFSPWPWGLWIFMSLCCNEMRTSSVSFVTSNKYCKRSWNGVITDVYTYMNRGDVRREVIQSLLYLWVLQECPFVVSTAPQRFRSGSAFLDQLPKCTYSFQVLWTLINEVFMTRHTSASVKNLHQSVNDILKIWTESIIKIWKSGINCPEIVLWLRKFITYQNSPSSSTVMPSLCLSVSPTFAHSSELANKNKARKNV